MSHLASSTPPFVKWVATALEGPWPSSGGRSQVWPRGCVVNVRRGAGQPAQGCRAGQSDVQVAARGDERHQAIGVCTCGASAKGWTKSGGLAGRRTSHQERPDAGMARRLRRLRNAGRRALMSNKPGVNWWGAVGELAGDASGCQKRAMLLNCTAQISSERC